MNKQIMGVTMGAVAGFAACWMFVGMSGCGKGADVLAVVNGEPITVEEYYKYLEFKPKVQVVTGSGLAELDTAGSLGFQALQDLISQRVTTQLAKDKKIYPTEGEVTQELEFKKKLDPNWLNARTQRGLTFDMIRQSLTLDLIQERLLTAGIKVTAADADAYVVANPKEFLEPSRADISVIIVQDAQTQKKVDADLKMGQSFTQVALRYSAAPDAKQTNAKLIDRSSPDLTPAIDSLPQLVQNAIKGFKGGETTDWIPMTDGSRAKFLVSKITPERKMVLDEAKKEFLRRELAKKKGVQARDIGRQVLVKLKDSKVDVRRTAYQKQWESAYKEFMAQAKLEDLTGSSGR